MIPSAWPAVVLAFAAFRLVRLVGWDDFPPIEKLRQRATGQRVYRNATESTGPIYRYKRPLLAHFLACPFCQGFWVSVAVYAVWAFEPRWAMYAAAPLALSSFVGLVARNLDP